jgi:antitoxin ParD1/3/4
MAKISISMSDQMESYVHARIKSGDYNNVSEYFRDLVRREQENTEKYAALKKAIQEGLDSGVSDLTIDDAWSEAERESHLGHG